MSSLILHSFRRCPFAVRVRMTLEEKNLPYTLIEEDLSQPSETLLRLHPEGKVPLLLHQNQVIYESAVITEYLDEAFPSPSLMPVSPQLRAQLRLWTFWCNHIFKPDLDLYKYQLNTLNTEDQAALLTRLGGYLTQIESGLNQRMFLFEDKVTLADIHLFPFFRQLQKSKPEFSRFSSYLYLNKWCEKMNSLPSFERAIKK